VNPAQRRPIDFDRSWHFTGKGKVPRAVRRCDRRSVFRLPHHERARCSKGRDRKRQSAIIDIVTQRPEAMPCFLRAPRLYMGTVLERRSGLGAPHSMSPLVAVPARRCDVGRLVATSIAFRMEVLSCCLMTPGSRQGKAVRSGEGSQVVEPHWLITISAPAALRVEAGFAKFPDVVHHLSPSRIKVVRHGFWPVGS
jgi:hypothetical protein